MGYAIRFGECIAFTGATARVVSGSTALRRGWGWLAAGMIAATPLVGGSLPAAQASTPAASEREIDSFELWNLMVLEALRRLYERLGGNPADLDDEPRAAMNQIENRYRTHGIPPQMTPEQRNATLYDVNTCRSHLADSNSTLDPGTTQWFLGVLDEIEAALMKPGVPGPSVAR